MFASIIENLVVFVWYYPVVILCLLSAFYFSFRLRFIQLKSFKHGLDLIFGKYDSHFEKGQITHFQALCAALSGTIGLGNIAGVAIAIALGGPGSIFWMWIVGLLGMATKFVECTLGTHYRVINSNGEVHGGPMYYIQNGLNKNWKWLANVYSVLIVFAGFGSACMFQSNQAAAALNASFNIPLWVTGICLFFLTGIVILGGIKRIASVASKIVPLMCLVYVSAAFLICIFNYKLLPYAFSVILHDAFTGNAAAGGAIGMVMIWGVRRAIFSNEAGLGSAAIAHAAVKTNYAVREGVVASLGPFIDTIIVCTSTALIIVLSGLYGSGRFISENLPLYNFEDISFESNYTSLERINYSSEFSSPQNDFGNFYLSYNALSSNLQNSSFQVGPILFSDSAFKFYSRCLSGQFLVKILDSNKNVISNFILGRKASDLRSTITGFESIDMFKIINLKIKDHWQSIVIDPVNLKNTFSPISKFYLEFVPLNPKNTFFHFDNFAYVKPITGIELTTKAFDFFISGFGQYFISIAVFLFAFSTMITWSYYGQTAVYFLFGSRFIFSYKIIFILLAFYGAIESLMVVVNFSDLMIGLLVIPNILAIFLLLPKVLPLVSNYFRLLNSGSFKNKK